MKAKLTDAFIQKLKVSDGERVEVFDCPASALLRQIG
jgi:hypothetical protein